MKDSRPTTELTWGETGYAQAKVKEATSIQSRCFALTSKDLLCLSLVFPRRSLPHNSRLKTRAGNALLSVHADCSNVQPHLQQYFCYRLLFCRYHLSTILRYEINFLHYQQNYYRQYTSRNNNFMSAKIK